MNDFEREARGAVVRAVGAIEHEAQRARGETVHGTVADIMISCRVSKAGTAYRATWGCGGSKCTYDAMMATLQRSMERQMENPKSPELDRRTAAVLAAFRGHKDEFAMLRGVLLMSTNWQAGEALQFKDTWCDSRAIAARMDEMNRNAVLGGSMIRRVVVNGTRYVATYDEYGTLDTVAREGSAALPSTHPDVRRIVANADAIACHKDVKGISYWKAS